MKIPEINFPIYGIIVILSLIIGNIYIFLTLPKEEKNKNTWLYVLLNMTCAITFAKIETALTTKIDLDFLHMGLSSIGAAFGVILSAYIFEKIENHNGTIIKQTILSLPLIYGVSKIACFLKGCCYGIPYDKFGYIIYHTEKVFPIQLVETILFLILFFLLNKYKNRKHIIYITLVSCSFLKFILDFLRVDHLTKVITTNQISCIIVIIITFILWKRGQNDNRRAKKNTN